jgi:hypothetical protein
MAALTKQQAEPQVRVGPDIRLLFHLPDLTHLSGAMKKTAAQALVAIQFGLMKSSCPLK